MSNHDSQEMVQAFLNDRQRAFVMIALLADRNQVKDFIPFLPPHEQGAISEVFDRLLEKTTAEKKQVIIDELRRLSVETQMNFLPEIHPDWIVEALIPETPRTIATVLRHLPGQHIQYLLDHLPESMVRQLPAFSETFALNPELVSVLRGHFEARFVPMPSSRRVPTHLFFENLHLLSAEKLVALFHETGLREIALAFGTLNPKTIDLILKRLSRRDAALLKLRMEKKEVVSDDRLKKAQRHLLELDLAKGRDSAPRVIDPRAGDLNPESLFLESGFFVYSKALLPVHLEACRVIQQKMARVLGLLLKRTIDKNLPLNSEKTVLSYQKEITQIAQNLLNLNRNNSP